MFNKLWLSLTQPVFKTRVEAERRAVLLSLTHGCVDVYKFKRNQNRKSGIGLGYLYAYRAIPRNQLHRYGGISIGYKVTTFSKGAIITRVEKSFFFN